MFLDRRLSRVVYSYPKPCASGPELLDDGGPVAGIWRHVGLFCSLSRAPRPSRFRSPYTHLTPSEARSADWEPKNQFRRVTQCTMHPASSDCVTGTCFYVGEPFLLTRRLMRWHLHSVTRRI